MVHQTKTHHWVVDIASACNRLGTWGLDAEIRADLLAERAADLADQLADPARNSPTAVLGRATRTTIGDVFRRGSSNHMSALPLAFAFLVAAIGTFVDAATGPDPEYRVSMLFIGTGFSVLAYAGLRSPLLIRRTQTAVGSLAVAAGTGLGAKAIPFAEETSLFDFTAKTSLSLAALGFAALAIGLSTGWPRAPWLPGAVILVSAGLIVFSEIGWALYIASKSGLEMLAALLIAAGGLLFIRFFGRLRYLPVK